MGFYDGRRVFLAGGSEGIGRSAAIGDVDVIRGDRF